MICTTTCYTYIEKGIFFKYNKQKSSNKKKGKRKSIIRIRNNCRGISIDERPKEVDYRNNFGHWEMDTVKGSRGNTKANLLVLTERKHYQK